MNIFDKRGLPRPIRSYRSYQGTKLKPVPWVQRIDGEQPKWGFADKEKVELCLKCHLCGVCGLIVDEGIVYNIGYIPLHPKCAIMARIHCPALNQKLKDRTLIVRSVSGYLIARR